MSSLRAQLIEAFSDYWCGDERLGAEAAAQLADRALTVFSRHRADRNTMTGTAETVIQIVGDLHAPEGGLSL